MDIDQRKLEVFCVVAETKRFCEAADALSISQSTVTTHISELEDFLRTTLINRSPASRDRLTAAGKVLYKHAKEIMRLHEFSKKRIVVSRSHAKAGVRIGAVTAFENHVLPEIISDFSADKPSVRLNISAGDSNDIFNDLSKGVIDIGIVDEAIPHKKMLLEHLMSDEFFVIVPCHHPWSCKEIVSLRSVVRGSLILREEGSLVRRFTEDHIALSDMDSMTSNAPLILNSAIAIIESVERGIGISIASKWDIRTAVKRKRVTALAISESIPSRQFYLVTKRGAKQSRETGDFIDYLKSYPYDKKCGISKAHNSIECKRTALAQAIA